MTRPRPPRNTPRAAPLPILAPRPVMYRIVRGPSLRGLVARAVVYGTVRLVWTLAVSAGVTIAVAAGATVLSMMLG